MKKNILIVLGLLYFASCSPKQEQQNPKTESFDAVQVTTETNFGLDVLSEKLMQTNGEIITLGEVLEHNKGKVILIDIWASWCPDCIEGLPKLQRLQQEYPLVYVFLSYDKTKEVWLAAIEKYGVSGENFLLQSEWKTGTFRKNLHIDWIPRYILVDKDGGIAHFRAIEADDEQLVNKIKRLIL